MVKQKNPAPRRPTPWEAARKAYLTRDLAERNAEIYRLVVIQEQSLVAVGKPYDLSGERIRQIAVKGGLRKYGAKIYVRHLRRIEKGQCIECGVTEKEHNEPWACAEFQSVAMLVSFLRGQIGFC